MRGKGVNYDTGFLPGGHDSRPVFDQAVVAAEMRIIARELGCTAVRVSGSGPERIARLGKPSPQMYLSFARLPKRLNAFLAEAADAVRGRFGGPLTYAAGTWEPVDWSRFDIVGVDAYRDASNARSFRAGLRKQFRHGKPVVATKYGCCPYAGAADKGGLGWDIADYDDDGVPTLRGEFQRDESEQVRYLKELNQIFAEEGLDLAFWFTFAGYHQPASPDPRRDVDLASYGLVSMLPEGPGSGYQRLGWRPRLAFEAMAGLKAAGRPQGGPLT